MQGYEIHIILQFLEYIVLNHLRYESLVIFLIPTIDKILNEGDPDRGLPRIFVVLLSEKFSQSVFFISKLVKKLMGSYIILL